ncbi:hypothetical protein B0H10DRAFT_1791738 [Mycena sp. CBHHK59/15]|nr:hypothetical protein B0H10DRAFT_1791738 [Mycena sp. CBHHK59/15]
MKLLLGICAVALWYLYRLSIRLRASPASRSSRLNAHCSSDLSSAAADELESVSYKDIDMMKAIPPVTHSGYAVVGGSGFLGTYLIRLLILRGETCIRILDVAPPPPHILDHPSVSFVKTDITSLESVRAALTQPFLLTGSPPSVIYHTAATIRFWERASYCWDTTYRVNVIGTQNVLTVAKELPSAMVIYTSSVETVAGCPKFMRIDWDTCPVSIRDDDRPPAYILKQGCYARSKRMAEQLVISASVNDGLKTGILRPGHVIMGPNDPLISMTLTMPRLPVWDQLWTSTNICVWDCAAAPLRTSCTHLELAEYILTLRKHYATRVLIFDEVPPLLIYALAHAIELFLWLRYHLLLPFALLRGTRPSVTPKWLGQAVFLQPTTLDGQLVDCIVDDSRARKVLGYAPQWDTPPCIRYTVDEIQSGNVAAVHGLKV